MISISEEFLKDHVSDLSEDDEEESDDEREWFQTPLIRRIKKIRETNLHNAKRKLGTTLDVGSDEGPPKPKRSNSSTSLGMQMFLTECIFFDGDLRNLGFFSRNCALMIRATIF